MIVSDLAYLEELVDESAKELIGGDTAAPAAVFEGGSSGVFTIANFGNSNTQGLSTSFSNLNGSFPAFNVSFGTNISVTSVFPA